MENKIFKFRCWEKPEVKENFDEYKNQYFSIMNEPMTYPSVSFPENTIVMRCTDFNDKNIKR